MIEAVKRMIYKSREEKDEDKMIVLRDPDVEGSILATDILLALHKQPRRLALFHARLPSTCLPGLCPAYGVWLSL